MIKRIYLKILHKLKSLLQYFNRKSNSSIVIPPEIIDDSFRKSNHSSATTNLKFIFRADKTNVGDWWCPPWRYFQFKPGVVGDIFNPEFKISETDTLILGGGGIGSETFRPHLNRIKEAKANVSILWGAGVDSLLNRDGVLSDGEHDLYGNYFDFLDEKGIRVFSSPQKFNYVPCASCMNNLFLKYREKKPRNKVGVYNHKRVSILNADNPQRIPIEDNSGDNIKEKLEFLSDFEYIITNTYHGVYWATLLGRKVICIPFKSGLFSFKYPPTYCLDGSVRDEHFERAVAYEGVLEESRKINLDYYFMLANKYDLV